MRATNDTRKLSATTKSLCMKESHSRWKERNQLIPNPYPFNWPGLPVKSKWLEQYRILESKPSDTKGILGTYSNLIWHNNREVTDCESDMQSKWRDKKDKLNELSFIVPNFLRLRQSPWSILEVGTEWEKCYNFYLVKLVTQQKHASGSWVGNYRLEWGMWHVARSFCKAWGLIHRRNFNDPTIWRNQNQNQTNWKWQHWLSNFSH